MKTEESFKVNSLNLFIFAWEEVHSQEDKDAQ